MAETDRTIKLRDGRTLAFTEHGDLSGTPVFFIHGNPSSRLMRHPDESIVERLGARIITPDRPGYGRSDFQPGRKILDMPDDIAQLADALQIEQFAIFGVSAGSPYVAACAYRLPRRVTRAAIVSGVAPMNRKGAYDGMHRAWRTAFQTSTHLPGWLLRAPLWAQSASAKRTPDQALTNFGSMLSVGDRKKLQQPEIRARVTMSRSEATRQGHKGWVVEARLVVSPWGFPLEKITVPMDLWYWEGDKAIPPQMGRYLASRIPNSILHQFKRGGHLSIYDKWGEIIGRLIEEEQQTAVQVSAPQRKPAAVQGLRIYADDRVEVRHAAIPSGQTTTARGKLIIALKRPSADHDGQGLEQLIADLSHALQSITGAEHIRQNILEDKGQVYEIHLLPRYSGMPLAYWGAKAGSWPKAPQATAADIAELGRQIRTQLAQ